MNRSPRHVAGIIWAFVVMAVIAASCSSSENGDITLRVLTHDDFHIPQDALDAYTARTGVNVVIYREKDATAIADLLERSRSTPIADVVVGIDTLELNRVIESRTVEPYRPIGRDKLDVTLLVEDDWMTPISYLDACVNRSVSFYVPPDRAIDELPDPADLPPPVLTSIEEFIDPVHAPTVVIPDARTSRMGLYFLVALERLHPENNTNDDALHWPQFLDEMLRRGAIVTPTWEDAYFSHFLPGPNTAVDSFADVAGDDASGVQQPTQMGTERPVTWGSAGMAAVTVRFQPELPETVDIDVVTSGCVRIVHYAGVVAGTPNRLNAGRFLDEMTEPLFQFGVPDRFGSRPARPDIIRTEAWREFGVEVDAAIIDPVAVGDRWPVWQLTWGQIMTEFNKGEEPVEPEIPVTLP